MGGARCSRPNPPCEAKHHLSPVVPGLNDADIFPGATCNNASSGPNSVYGGGNIVLQEWAPKLIGQYQCRVQFRASPR